MKNNIPIISLFSGAGLLDLGFIKAGFQILWANDHDPDFVELYNKGLCSYFNEPANLFSLIKEARDITEISDKEIQDKINQKVSAAEFLGIIGGPPCQDFSFAGNHAGIQGERGRLIKDLQDKILSLQPDFFFFENVEGMIKNPKHKLAFEAFKNSFNDHYKIYTKVLNALDFGIPQQRKRVFVVAFKKEIIQTLKNSTYYQKKPFRWPIKEYENPVDDYPWPKAGALPDYTAIEKIPEKLTVKYAFQNLNGSTANQDEHFNPYSKKFETRLEGDTQGKSFKRLHRYKYSPAVAYGNNEVHLHPTENRRLTVREALRLQTAPDDYKWPSDISLTAKFKAISNGVPCELALKIAKQIKETMNNYQILKRNNFILSKPNQFAHLRRLLRDWYASNGRDFPWRKDTSPYSILLSEILLKRTKARMVKPVYFEIKEKYPSIKHLQKAKRKALGNILKPIGLYNQRASQLKECAEFIMNEYLGNIIDDKNLLFQVPGLGSYSVNAIRCFSYGHSVPVVDSNIARIILRLTGIKHSKYEPRRSPEVWGIAQKIVGKRSSKADLTNWALLDLAGKHCVSRTSNCEGCPLHNYCFYFDQQTKHL